MEMHTHKEAGLNRQKIKLEKAMTFRFGNDTGNQDCGHTRGSGVLRVHVVPGGTPLL